MADRLGVDLSVKGFSSFETNMQRVNELLDAFATKVGPFAEAVGKLDMALKALEDGSSLAAAGMTAFGSALKSFAQGGSRTLSGLPGRLTAAAAAMTSFSQASTGAATSFSNINIPNLPALTKQATAKGPLLDVTQDPNKMLDFMLAQQQKADQQTRANEESLASFRQKLADRRIADEERVAHASEQFRQKAVQANLKQNIDAAAAQKKLADQAAQEDKRGSATKASIDRIKAEQDERIAAVSDGLKRTAQLQHDARIRELQASFLGAKNEAAARKNIDSQFLSDIENIQQRATSVSENFSEARLRSLRRTGDEMRAITRDIVSDVNKQSLIKGPNVVAQGRARLRDDLSRTNLQTFLAGKAEQRARSSSQFFRTMQQSIDKVGDSIAIMGFRFQQAGQIISTIGKILILPFRIVLAPIFAVISAVNALIGAFTAVKNVVSAIASPFKAIGSIFGGAKKAPKQQGPADVGQGKTSSDTDRMNKALETSNAQFAALAGTIDKTSQAFLSLSKDQQAAITALENAANGVKDFTEQAKKSGPLGKIFNTIVSPITTIGNVAKGAVNSVRSLSLGFSATIGPINAFNTEAQNVINNTNQMGAAAGKTATLLNTTLGVTLGNLTSSFIQFSIQTVKSFAGQGLDALGSFEAQMLGIQTLARREILDNSNTISFADAETLAATKGKDLFDQLQQLAIISPFTTEDITQAFSLAESYDFTSQEALKLTKIIVDFAAGTGKNAQAIEQITTALGQVRAAGRLTGEEFRQLRANGVPVLRAIADATGKSTKEIDDWLRKGGVIDADLAITAIAKTLGTEFAGAADASSSSIRGLISSLQDLKSISLKNIVQPIAEQLLKPFAGALLDQLNSGEFEKRTKAVGEAIATAIIAPINAIGSVIGAFQALFAAIPEPVKAVALAFAELGSTIFAAAGIFRILQPAIAVAIPLLLSIVSPVTAIGLAIAALQVAWTRNWFDIQGVVTNAVTSIIQTAEQLAAHFTPSALLGALAQAPPFVLQIAQQISDIFAQLITNVVDFGVGIVTALAQGITSAVGVVLDALGQLGSAITDLLQAQSPPKLLPDLDKWGTAAADVWLQGWTQADFGVFHDLSDSIQKALNSIDPNIDSGEIQKIQTAVSDMVDSFAKTGTIDTSVLGTLGDFDASTIQVIQKLAQLTLEAAAATQKYEAAQKDLADATEHFDNLLKPIDDRLKSINSEEEKLDTGKTIAALQNVIGNRFATEAQKRKASLKLTQTQLEAEKKGVENQRDASLSAIQDRVDAAQKEQDIAQKTLDIFKERFDIQFQFAAQAEQMNKFGNSMDDAGKKAKKLKEKLGELSAPGLGTLADLKLPDVDLTKKVAPALDNFQKSIVSAKEKVGGTLTAIKTSVETNVTGIVKAFNEGMAGVNDPEQSNMFKFVARLGSATTTIQGNADKIKGIFDGLRQTFNQGFAQSGLGEVGKKGAEQIIPAQGLEGLAFRAGKAASSLSTAFSGILAGAQSFATDFGAAFATAGKEGENNPITKFFAALQSQGIQDDLEKIRTKIKDGITNLFDATTAGGTALVATVTTQLDLLFGTVNFTDLTTSFDNLVTKVKDAIGLIVWTITPDDFATFVTSTVDQVSKIPWVEHITVDIFGGLATAVKSAIGGIFSGVQSLLQGDLSGATTDVSKGVGGLVGGVTQSLGGVAQVAAGLLDNVDPSKIVGAITFALTRFVTSAISGVLPALTGAISILTEGDKSLLKSTAKIIGEAVAGVVGGLAVAIFSKGQELLTVEGIKKLLTDFDKLVEAAAKAISDIITGFIEGIIQTATVTPPEDTKQPKGQKPQAMGVTPFDDFNQTLEFLAKLPLITQKAKDIGVANREALKAATGVDLAAVTAGIEKFFKDVVVGNMIKSAGVIAELARTLPQFITDIVRDTNELVLDIQLFALSMDKFGADVIVKTTQANTAVSDALNSFINGMIGILNSTIDAINSFVANVGNLVANIPGLGSLGGGKGPLGQVKPVNIELGNADVQKSAQKAADDLQTKIDAVLAQKKLLAPPVEADATQIDKAGADTVDAYGTSLQKNFVLKQADFVSLGTDLGTGINQGAQTELDNSTAVTDYVDLLKTQARVQSPSQLTHDELGLPLGQGIIQGIKDAFATSGDLMAGLVSSLSTGGLQTSIQTSVAGITTAYTGMATSIKAIFNGIKLNIVASFTTMNTQIIAAAQALAISLKDIYTGLATDSLDIFQTFFDDMDSLFTDSYASLEDMTQNFSDDTVAIFQDFDDQVRKIMVGLIDKLISEFRRLGRTVPDIVDSVARSVETAFKKIRDDMTDLAKKGVDAAIAQFERLAPAVDAALDAVLASLTSSTRIGQIQTAAQNIGKAIVDGIITAFTGSAGNSAVNRLANAIIDVVTRAVNVAVAEIKGTDKPIDEPSSFNPFKPGPPVGGGGTDLGKLTDIWSALIGPNGDGLGVISSKMLGALISINDHLLGVNSAGTLATSGFSTVATTAPGGPIVIQTGDVTSIYEMNIGQVTERQALRLASSFSMFQRLNGQP